MGFRGFCKNGGQDRIRTCEGNASGFTVHPVWPLRNLPPKKIYSRGAACPAAEAAARGSILIDVITTFSKGKSLLSVGRPLM